MNAKIIHPSGWIEAKQKVTAIFVAVSLVGLCTRELELEVVRGRDVGSFGSEIIVLCCEEFVPTQAPIRRTRSFECTAEVDPERRKLCLSIHHR